MLEKVSGPRIRHSQVSTSSRRRNVDNLVELPLLSNLDLLTRFNSSSTLLTSEPLSPSHRFTSTSTLATHRIHIVNLLHQMNDIELFHIYHGASLSPSPDPSKCSDSVTGQQIPSCHS